MEKSKIYQGEALVRMDKMIEDGIVFDAIITDPPYGTTANKWDEVIPFYEMWERFNKLIKPNGAIIMTATEPFASKLRMSNQNNYKYDWVWEKDNGTNFASTKYQPFRIHENVLVFGDFATTFRKNGIYNYRPQMVEGTPYSCVSGKQVHGTIREGSSAHAGGHLTVNKGVRYPKSIQKINRDKNKVHPTQKPIALMEYLIKTYSDMGQKILDPFVGSGTTVVACQNTGRIGIGIEMDEKYYKIAKNRVKENKKRLNYEAKQKALALRDTE